ncbi:MAG: hypothetical protein Q9162_004782 [Coniocarpon cinnabarinum]
MTKLAIAAETDEDRYDVSTRVDCFECQLQGVDQNAGKLPEVVDGVMKANTFAKQEEVKAWEAEITACEHTLCLDQHVPKEIPSQMLGQCEKCDLKENLWLCLTCGALGCGRAQYGGVGGHSHALAHSKETSHPVAVKLGSLTADGTADIYCYTCDDERIDPELPMHLSNFGINIKDRQKTEKSLTEMQVEQNLRWEFSMTQDGKEMTPLFGEGFTGIKNLGNSCYLASVLQCLFDMPEFGQRYYRPGEHLPPATSPADDLETQLRKLADGLLSGRYSHSDSDVLAAPESSEVPHQKGLAPAMLKHLIGRGHSEFSTMRQQDAFELLLHILQLVSRSHAQTSPSNPVNAFKFIMEQRLQCVHCNKVRYREDESENITVPVPIRRVAGMTDADGERKDEFEAVTLKECLDIFTAFERVELTCPSCQSKDGFTKRQSFKTFPDILAVNCRRFDLVNWLPTKMDVPVIVGDEAIDFHEYRGTGLQASEEVLPEDADVGTKTTSNTFIPNEMALSMLEAMGFPRVRCEKALKATGNEDAEAASNWLFEHMEDPDIDVPMPDDAATHTGSAGAIDPAAIDQLGAMGFDPPLARQALKETGGDPERAVDWLFSHPDAQGDFEDNTQADGASEEASAAEKKAIGVDDAHAKFQLQSIVCHKGTSIHAGHYVAFVRKQLPGSKRTDWVLFNDEKVAQASDAEEMKKFAYIYFLRRLSA